MPNKGVPVLHLCLRRSIVVFSRLPYPQQQLLLFLGPEEHQEFFVGLQIH
jgi:hypothetical protein